MGIDKNEALQIDFEEAKSYAHKYIVHLQRQIVSRAMILNGAIQDFNSFRDLPASSSSGAAIWDFAFGLVSAAVPALKLGEFIAKQHERATLALNAAKNFGNAARRSDKIVKGVTGGLQTGGKIGGHLNTVKDLREKLEKISPEAKELASHAARAPIMELIGELNAATAMWDDAVEAIMTEWKNRLADAPSRSGTLLSIAREILKDLPKSFTSSELDEIWTLYLYFMVGKLISDTCKYVETVTDYGYGQSTTTSELQGLNDAQEGKIVEWFGFRASRGRIFDKPPFWFVREFYMRWPIHSVTRRRSRTGDIRAKW